MELVRNALNILLLTILKEDAIVLMAIFLSPSGENVSLILFAHLIQPKLPQLKDLFAFVLMDILKKDQYASHAVSIRTPIATKPRAFVMMDSNGNHNGKNV